MAASSGVAALHVAVRAGLDLTVIVCNDAAHGAEHVQLREGQMDPGRATVALPGFAVGARAMGGAVLTVRGVGDLPEALAVLCSAVRPLRIDLRPIPDAIPRLHP